MKPHIYLHRGQWYARAFDQRGTQHVGLDPHHNDPAHAYSALIDLIEESNDRAHTYFGTLDPASFGTLDPASFTH